jgi:hypothetical protein
MVNPNYSASEASRDFVSFEAGDNLDAILAKLFEMQQKGQILKGSSKEFSPAQLAQSVLQAGEAMKKYMGRLDSHLTNEDYEKMVEINNITRAGNLRQAVIESLQRAKMKNEGVLSPKGEQIYTSLIQQESKNL